MPTWCAIRHGIRTDGTSLLVMPWRLAGRMTDEELHALWLYLKSVPAAKSVR